MTAEAAYRDQDGQVIFSPQLANYLLKHGYRIQKLKAKRDDPEKTVFVFYREDGISECMDLWRVTENKN